MTLNAGIVTPNTKRDACQSLSPLLPLEAESICREPYPQPSSSIMRSSSRTSLHSGGIILALQTLYPRAPSLTRQIIRSIRDRKAILSLNAVVITIASLARIRHPTPSLRKHTQRTDSSNNRLSSARSRHRVPPLVTIVRVHQFYHSCISTSQPHSRHI
jgi:hypothetical protein